GGGGAVAARGRAVGGLGNLLLAGLVPRGDRLLQPAHRPAGGVHAHAEEGHAGPATAALPRGLDAAGGGLLHEGVAARSAEGVGLLHVAEQLASVLVVRSEEHTSELQSREKLVCRLLLE